MPTNLLIQLTLTASRAEFLDQAVPLLRVGGSLAYSTCSWNPDENEGMVRYVLDRYPTTLKLVDVGVPLGKEGRDCFGLDLEQRRMVRRWDEADNNGRPQQLA